MIYVRFQFQSKKSLVAQSDLVSEHSQAVCVWWQR